MAHGHGMRRGCHVRYVAGRADTQHLLENIDKAITYLCWNTLGAARVLVSPAVSFSPAGSKLY